MRTQDDGGNAVAQWKVGSTDLAFVSDGEILLCPAALYGDGAEEAFRRHDRGALLPDGRVRLAMGALLIRTAEQCVLVDLGWGVAGTRVPGSTGLAPTEIRSGSLLHSLESAGVMADDVDLVLLSHLHGDHIGWLLAPGSVPGRYDYTFRRASYRMFAEEWNYWDAMITSPRFGWPTRQQLDALSARLDPLEEGEEGEEARCRCHRSPHARAHARTREFVISSGRDRALVLGDTIHCPLEIEQPDLQLLATSTPWLRSRPGSGLTGHSTRGWWPSVLTSHRASLAGSLVRVSLGD